DGIQITASENDIGGTQAGLGNVISGNKGNGIEILEADASGNVIVGNIIGFDRMASTAVGNSQNGVVLAFGNNTVGGTQAGAGNIIAGNSAAGIYIANSTANKVYGNRVGTNIANATNLGNGTNGIVIDNGGTNNIGGIDSTFRNIISGN